MNNIKMKLKVIPTRIMNDELGDACLDVLLEWTRF